MLAFAAASGPVAPPAGARLGSGSAIPRIEAKSVIAFSMGVAQGETSRRGWAAPSKGRRTVYHLGIPKRDITDLVENRVSGWTRLTFVPQIPCFVGNRRYRGGQMNSTVEQVIREKLTASLAPTRCPSRTNPTSTSHASPQTGESHFRLEIVSNRFEGLNRVDRQRLVYEALAQELAGPLHALSHHPDPSEDRQGAPNRLNR